jgi:hypothetical protein
MHMCKNIGIRGGNPSKASRLSGLGLNFEPKTQGSEHPIQVSLVRERRQEASLIEAMIAHEKQRQSQVQTN